MNYLDIVNSVLRRMREDTVSSLYENRQSSVVAELINDAKRHVENAHNWSALRTDLTIATAGGINSYRLVGSTNRATIMDVRNVTSSAMIRQVPASWIRRQDIITNSPGETRPSYWASDGVHSSGDMLLRLWPTPDDVYVIKAFCIIRDPDLAAEGDQLTIPSQPVLMLATAMAAQERGGVDSIDVQSAYTLAQKSLGEHVMLDAGLNPDEQIWYPQ